MRNAGKTASIPPHAGVLTLLAVTTAFLPGCDLLSGGDPQEPADTESGTSGQVVSGDNPDSGGTAGDGFGQIAAGGLVTARIPVSLSGPRAAPGFFLASATSFTIELDGCATGHTASADETSTALSVFLHDRGCKAKLTAFQVNGRDYAPTAGDPFASWSAGDLAIFDEAGEPGTDALLVKVVAQLQDPVTGTDSVEYAFSELITGAGKTILGIQRDTGAFVPDPPAAPPSFTIKSVGLMGTTGTGAGEFEFVLECTASIGGTEDCAGVDMGTMRYKLTADTYGGAPAEGDLDTLFAGGATAVVMPDDREAPGGATTNGGFRSATIAGPDDMAGNPAMLLVIEAAGDYQVFNVDVVVAN